MSNRRSLPTRTLDAQGPSPGTAPRYSPVLSTHCPSAQFAPPAGCATQLQIQANGLGGHLDETWPDVGPNSGWLGGTGESWERGPYFLDGLVPLAYLLDDPRLKAKAQKLHRLDPHLPATRRHDRPHQQQRLVAAHGHAQSPRAILGSHRRPARPPLPHSLLRLSARNRCPRVPCTTGESSAGKTTPSPSSGSTTAPETRPPHSRPPAPPPGLRLAGATSPTSTTPAHHTPSTSISPKVGLSDLALSTHGVNNGQAIKAAPVWSLLTNNPPTAMPVHQMLSALDKYHGLPNGMFSCDEHFAGRNPSQGSELCTVVETMFSLEQSLAILGDPTLGDRLEQIAFNALPGAITDDMWAHQYNQEPNQVECSLHHKPWTTDGPESNLFGLDPNFGCCTANFHQGWPKFTASLWMASNDNGLVATAYSPSEVDTMLGDTPIRISKRPITHSAVTSGSPSTPRHRCIPAYASNSRVGCEYNAPHQRQGSTPARTSQLRPHRSHLEKRRRRRAGISPAAKAHARIQRLHLHRARAAGFLLPHRRILGKAPRPRHDRRLAGLPRLRWNYALAVDQSNVAELQTKESPVAATPFALKATSVEVEVKARKLTSWRAVDGAADPVPASPVSSDRTRREDRPRPLRRRQTPHHRLPAVERLKDRIRRLA